MRKTIIILFFFIQFITMKSYAFSAQSAIMIDGGSGRVLFEHNSRQRLGMASTTKIMTAILAIENGNLKDIVKVSENATKVEGSSMWLKEGEKLTLEALIYGLMLNSGNDSATAIAEHLSGNIKDFVELMNAKAKSLGLNDTRFANPHGLSDTNHYTTAYDLAQITKYAMKNEIFRKIVSTKKQTLINEETNFKRYLKNHNKLLNMYEYCEGVKTGFTKADGRCLVSSACREELRLIVVTLNDPGDWQDHIELFNFGFDNYHSKMIVKKNEYFNSVSVKGGVKDKVKVIASDNFSIALSDEEEKQLKIYTELEETLSAPVYYGQKVGNVKIDIKNKEFYLPLIAKEDIDEKRTISYKNNLSFVIHEILALFLK